MVVIIDFDERDVMLFILLNVFCLSALVNKRK